MVCCVPKIQLTSSFNPRNNCIKYKLVSCPLSPRILRFSKVTNLAKWQSPPLQVCSTPEPMHFTTVSPHHPSSFPPATDRYRLKGRPLMTFCRSADSQVGTQAWAVVHGPPLPSTGSSPDAHACIEHPNLFLFFWPLFKFSPSSQNIFLLLLCDSLWFAKLSC